MNIYLPVTTLEPWGQGISFQVPLLIRAPYSTSIAARQFESVSATWTKVRMADCVIEVATTMMVSQSFAHVTIE
jgi:hypothetical protein